VHYLIFEKIILDLSFQLYQIKMYRIIFPIFLACFGVFNIVLSISYIIDTSRIIEVKKAFYADDKQPGLNKYHIVNTPTAVFDIEVQAKTFWDYTLLFRNNENLLSVLFQFGGICCVIGYFIKTIDDDDFKFDDIKLRWLRYALVFVVLAVLAIPLGQLHTKDLWESIYSYNANNIANAYYYVEVIHIIVPVCLFISIGVMPFSTII
jgi:hypothetical protein